MAVYFHTDKPKALLGKFNSAIRQTEPKGKIETWEFSDDEKFYTHTSKQWNKEAWFKASTSDGLLTFNIIKPGNKDVTIVAYGFYHGHLIETFLNHFDGDFSRAEATAGVASGDKVKD